jgi:chitin disaccharide deacetylase
VKALIVNADDFGASDSVNGGVARCFEEGIVTSASLMVRGTAAGEAATYARAHVDLAVGLHIDLGEWIYRDGGWVAVYERCRGGDAACVAAEVQWQLDEFRRLVGCDPTHLDSHQHVHRVEPAATVARRLAGRLGIPLRHEGPIHYRGEFYGRTTGGDAVPDAVGTEALLRIIGTLETGVTELGCHPGAAGTGAWEVDALCDPQVRLVLADARVELGSFADHASAGAPVAYANGNFEDGRGQDN